MIIFAHLLIVTIFAIHDLGNAVFPPPRYVLRYNMRYALRPRQAIIVNVEVLSQYSQFLSSYLQAIDSGPGSVNKCYFYCKVNISHSFHLQHRHYYCTKAMCKKISGNDKQGVFIKFHTLLIYVL